MEQLNNHIKSNIENTKNDTKKCIQKFKNILDLDLLPADLNISTMTIICKFYTKFDTENIGMYVELDPNKIVSVSYGDKSNSDTNRSLIKTKKKRKKNNSKAFYNQTTVCVMSSIDNKILNAKIFKNGSIQMTGCKSIPGCIDVLNIICKEFSKIKAIIDPDSLAKIILKPFVSNIAAMSLDKINDLKICMINSGFNIGFCIDREELYKVLSEENIECKCDLDNHACVNIKYNYKDRKKVSIFVFASGAVIITGANNCNHILEAYEFITIKMVDHYQKIKNVSNISNSQDIRKFLDYNDQQVNEMITI